MNKKEQSKNVIFIISKVCEEICNDYCKYSDTKYDGKIDQDGTCGHYEDCPLNKLQ